MKIVAAVVLAVLVGIVLLARSYPGGSWRYRMTVAVETPEGIKTGSAVREVFLQTQPNLLGNSGAVIACKGEAVAVDLGARGVLFALLRSERVVDHASFVFLDAFPLPGMNNSGGIATRAGIEHLNQLKKAKAELPRDQLPMLVRFRDIDDPKTVERVDPASLSLRFGAGVKLVGVTIETTDDPVSMEIEKRLGWLRGRSKVKGYLGGWPDDPSKLYLNGSEFWRNIP